MLRTLTITLLALGLCYAPDAEGKSKHESSILLDGEPLAVHWSDGDSFRVKSRAYKGLKTRVVGFNTLESHGPVHRWGEWDPKELLAIATQATKMSRAKRWLCQRVQRKDGAKATDHYGRVLVMCPGLAAALIAEGLAHLFVFDAADADPSLVKLQGEAQAKKKGMWRKGVPEAVMTSVHSADEKPDDPGWRAYNRMAKVRSGLSYKVDHDDSYHVCEEVCEAGACLIYVPFKSRYGKKRAACLNY